MFLDEEISQWCGGLTWRCTPSEAIGLWSVVFFYSTLVIGTIAHSIAQNRNGFADGATRYYRTTIITPTSTDDEVLLLCSLLIYFFTLTAGMLLWALKSVDGAPNLIHPFQIWQIQLLGSFILIVCTFLFIVVHIDLGKNWSPQPEKKAHHELVTDGIYRYARHPMYAIFLWAGIGTLLATLNFVITWCVFGLVFITLRRIETEELILVELFGEEYLEYRRRVSALGFPWGCLGYDREITAMTPRTQRRQSNQNNYNAIV